MRISIHTRLGLVFVGFTLSVLATTIFIARWSFEQGFIDYFDGLERHRVESIATQMAEVYAQDSRWPDDVSRRFVRAASKPPPHRPPHLARGGIGPPPAHMRRPGATGPHPTALFDASRRHLGGADLSSSSVERISVPVLVDAHVVGFVESVPHRQVSRPLGAAFERRQLWSSVVIGLVLLLLAVAFATIIARALLAPIKRLAEGVSEVSRGNYDVEFEGARNDELGDLLHDFQTLTRTLREIRDARQRMFADIAHELRTPLSILSGEIEALQDGVRTFDAQALNSLSEEVERLTYLVGDLHELSTSDLGMLRYQFEICDVRDVVLNTLGKLSVQASAFEVSATLSPAVARVDKRRLEQLCRNVLLNSMAYTHTPGRIEVDLKQHDNTVEIIISDSAPSVPSEECERLFDPLYRVEASRSRRTAGSGLGLAISRKIAEAHGGTISAEPSSLGGLEVKIILPSEEVA
ncbi:MAG: ATP-binding protein [Bradymonadia bacterium]